MKTILRGPEARAALLRGMEELAECVAATLGPQGRNAVISVGWGQIPNSTRDGVTVAKAIDLSDPVADAGAQLLKHVATRTAEIAGDGTTTATILACYLCRAAIDAVSKGANPVALRREILAAADQVAEHLRKSAIPVSGDSIEQVATISANNDGKLGKLIAEAIRLAGVHGILTVEDSSNLDTTVESAEGMRLRSGWASPYFVNDQAKQEFRAEDCKVLIFEKKLGNLTQGMQDTLGKLAATREPLLILAESIEGDMLATLVANRMGNAQRNLPSLPWCAVRLPQGTSRDSLHDIAAVIGGSAITEDRGISDEQSTMQFVGTAKNVRVTRNHTTITGSGRTGLVDERIRSIEIQLADTEDLIERDRFQERLVRLSGGIATIRVGASSEVELRDKKARIEDAIHATRAAIEEGVLPGGGIALFRAQAVINGKTYVDNQIFDPGLVKKYKNLPGAHFAATGDSAIATYNDTSAGERIVYEALSEPLRRIVENAGESAVRIVTALDDPSKPSFGWNALTGKFEDLIAAGVIDPAKVTITALLSAASVAAQVISTEVLIVNVEDPQVLLAPAR
jgi:chaperonin GroEL